MKGFQYWSVRSQLIIGLSLVLSIMLTAASVWHYQYTKAIIIEDSRLHAKDAITSSLREIFQLLNEVEFSSNNLQSVLRSQSLDIDAKLLFLNKALKASQHIKAFTVQRIDKSNEFSINSIYTTLSDKSQQNYSDSKQQYLSSEVDSLLAGKSIWSEAHILESGDTPVMSYLSVLRDNEDELLLLRSDLALEYLNEVIREINISEKAEVLLLDKSWRIMAAENSDLMMVPLLDQIKSFADTDEWLGLLPKLKLSENLLTNIPCIFVDDDCLIASQFLNQYGLHLLVVYPHDEIYQSLHSFTQYYSLIGSSLIVLLLLSTVWFSRTLIQPITKLADNTQEMIASDFSLELIEQSSNAEVRHLSSALNTLQQSLKDYMNNLQAKTASLSRIETELKTAYQIQMSLVPGQGKAKRHFAGFDVAAALKPARSVGGDIYQFQQVDDQLVFMLGDVSDKGVSAALFMVKVASLFQRLAVQANMTPELILAELNQGLCENNDACMFVTLCLGQLDLQTGALKFASAGHEAPLLISQVNTASANTFTVSEVEQHSSTALGLIPGVEYQSQTILLEPHQQLLLYTDGISEAFNAEHQAYGLQRLIDLISKQHGLYSEGLIEALLNDVANFVQEAEQSDDIAVLLLGYQHNGGDSND